MVGIFVLLGGGLVRLWPDGITFGGAGMAFIVAAVGITMLEKRHDTVATELGLVCPACERIFVERTESKLRAGRCRCGQQVVARTDRLAKAVQQPSGSGLPTLEQLRWRARGYRLTELVVSVVGAGAVLIGLGAPFRLPIGVGRGFLYVVPLLAALVVAWWWLADRLPHWFGVTCPACDTLLVGNKEEGPLGAAGETKECPECGAAIAE
jgi:hypothetical protein